MSARRAIPIAFALMVGLRAYPAAASAGLTEVAILYSHDAQKIPNGHGAAHITMPFDSLRQVGAVEADFRVRHERTQQLKLVLKAPTGDRVVLSDGATRGQNLGQKPCVEDSNEVDFTQFDDSGQAIASGSAPYVGTFAPEEPLSSLSGISPTGDWSLIVKDTASSGDAGKFLCGRLFITLPPS